MKTALFIKTYRGDFPWLGYCLRSITKFVTGVDEIVIAVEKDEARELSKLGLTRERIEIVPRYAKDGYLDQQIHKLLAYHYTPAERVLFFDSDCIAIRPFCPDDLTIEGIPRVLMTPYAKLIDEKGNPATPWQPITAKVLRRHPESVEYEFMRSHPFLVPRVALAGFSLFMREEHGMTQADYIAAQPGREFSEWNALHAWAYYHFPYHFEFRNTEIHGVPEPFVKQFWSYSGITPEVRDEMERLLA